SWRRCGVPGVRGVHVDVDGHSVEGVLVVGSVFTGGEDSGVGDEFQVGPERVGDRVVVLCGGVDADVVGSVVGSVVDGGVVVDFGGVPFTGDVHGGVAAVSGAARAAQLPVGIAAWWLSARCSPVSPVPVPLAVVSACHACQHTGSSLFPAAVGAGERVDGGAVGGRGADREGGEQRCGCCGYDERALPETATCCGTHGTSSEVGFRWCAPGRMAGPKTLSNQYITVRKSLFRTLLSVQRAVSSKSAQFRTGFFRVLVS